MKNPTLTYDGHAKQELVKMPYPPLAPQRPMYAVERKIGRHYQELYFGASHHVARLIVNTVVGAHLRQKGD